MNVIRQRFHADHPAAGTSGGGLRAAALLRRMPGFARLVAAIAIVAIVLLPTIYMVLMSLRTGDDIIARCRTRIAHYKVPTHWRIAVEPLPRNATGKVVRPAVSL